jgi:hypothetical protein
MSCWGNLWGRCFENNKVTKTSLSPRAIRRVVAADAGSGEDADTEEEHKSISLDADESLSPSLPGVPDVSSTKVQKVLKTQIAKSILDWSNIFMQDTNWKCQENLHVCLPASSSASSTKPTSTDGKGSWNDCQTVCNDNSNSTSHAVYLEKEQQSFLTLVLKTLLSLTLPGGTEDVIEKYGLPGYPNNNASSTATAIRIIFALTFSDDMGDISRALKDLIELHWPPLYNVALLMGISDLNIYKTAGHQIDASLEKLRVLEDILEENLTIDTLNYKTIDNLKKLKICVHRYLKNHARFIDIIDFISQQYGFKRKKIGTTLYEIAEEDLDITSHNIKNLCTSIKLHSERITPDLSIDALIMSMGPQLGGSTLDLTAFEIATMLRGIAEDICQSFSAFSKRTRNLQ